MLTPEELQALKEAFAAAGAIGSAGFEAAVRYTWSVALSRVIAGVVMIVAGGFFTRLAVRKADGDQLSGWSIVAMTAGLAAVMGFVPLVDSLPDLIEPTGATVVRLVAGLR